MTEPGITNFYELIHGELEDEFHEAVARLAYDLSINGEIHNRNFAYHYMKFIYENVSRKKSQIMSHTGFSKYVVKKFIDDYQSKKQAAHNPNKNIYLEFFHSLKAACTKTPDQSLPIYGLNSVRSIFEACRINDSSHTLPSILKTLEKSELIKISKKRICLISQPQLKNRTSKADYSRQLSNTLKYLVSTKVTNRKANTYFDQTVTSIEIEDDMVVKIIKQLQSNAREFHKNTRDYIDEHEIEGTKNANRKIGFQVYIFNVEK